MHLFKNKKDLRHFIQKQRIAGKKIGFVPTMGALHEGHLSLVRRSLKENECTVCSIYVNPTQFDRKEDLSRYPRNFEKDLKDLENEGCDVVFLPNDKEIYPQETTLSFSFGHLDTILEGAKRVGHFNGVGLVVSKLFHIVAPDSAYFGQKDYQQFLIIQTLIKDLSFPIHLVRCPIVREENGLAMSSRNQLLLPNEKTKAGAIYQNLKEAAAKYKNQQSIHSIEQKAKQHLESQDFRVDYFSVVSAQTLLPISERKPNQKVVIVVAAWLGKVRLLDNVLLNS